MAHDKCLHPELWSEIRSDIKELLQRTSIIEEQTKNRQKGIDTFVSIIVSFFVALITAFLAK